MFPTTHACIGATTSVILLKNTLNQNLGLEEGLAFLTSFFLGVVFGMLPDYDIIFKHIKSQIYYLENHRKTSHSIFLHLIISIGVSFLAKYFVEYNILDLNINSSSYDFQYIGFAIFVILFSHVLLDALTSWGVYYFYPFKKAFASKSVFILDFVVILLNLTQILLYIIQYQFRIHITYIYLPYTLIFIYLFLSLLMRNFWVVPQFKRALIQQNISYSEIDVKPTFLNNILWTANIRTQNGYMIGYYSIFIKGIKQIKFVPFSKNYNLLDPDDVELFHLTKRFKKIVDNWYVVTKKDNHIYLNDVRYGFRSSDLDEDRFAEEYKVIINNDKYDFEKKVILPNSEILKKLIIRFFKV